MAKSLADYLGSNAIENDNLITVSLSELYFSIFPEATEAYSYSGNPDELVSILVAGIHARCKPQFDENGLDVTPNTTAVVAAQSFQPKTFQLRGDKPQVRHEFVFNIYTEDNTAFNPVNAV